MAHVRLSAETTPDVPAAEDEMKRLAFSVGKIVGASLPKIDVDFSLKIIRHLKKDTGASTG